MAVMASLQAPDTVVMIRPHRFLSNPQTMADNAFQHSSNAKNASHDAYNEVTNAVDKLRSHGVRVHLFEDQSGNTPDSVFPNNWFSAHHNGLIIKYPMYAENQRS
jgi:hypothetical protein